MKTHVTLKKNEIIVALLNDIYVIAESNRIRQTYDSLEEHLHEETDLILNFDKTHSKTRVNQILQTSQI